MHIHTWSSKISQICCFWYLYGLRTCYMQFFLHGEIVLAYSQVLKTFKIHSCWWFKVQTLKNKKNTWVLKTKNKSKYCSMSSYVKQCADFGYTNNVAWKLVRCCLKACKMICFRSFHSTFFIRVTIIIIIIIFFFFFLGGGGVGGEVGAL